jgi:hypothetical protein
VRGQGSTSWTKFASLTWPVDMSYGGERDAGMLVAALCVAPGSGLVGARRLRRSSLSKHADIAPGCHLAPPEPSPSPEKPSAAATTASTVLPVRSQLRRRSSSSPRAVSSRIQCLCSLPSLHPAPRRPARRPCSSGEATSPPIQRDRRASSPPINNPAQPRSLLTPLLTLHSHCQQQEPEALRPPASSSTGALPRSPLLLQLALVHLYSTRASHRAQFVPLVLPEPPPGRRAAGIAIAGESRKLPPPETKGATSYVHL